MNQHPMTSIAGVLTYCETLNDTDKENLRALVNVKTVEELEREAREGIRHGQSRFLEVAIVLRKLYDLGVY